MWAGNFIKNILGKWWEKKDKINIGTSTDANIKKVEEPLFNVLDTDQTQEVVIENNIKFLDKFSQLEDENKDLSLKDIQYLIVETSELESYVLNKLENLINKKEYSQFRIEKEFMDIINEKIFIKTLIESDFNINKLVSDNRINLIKDHELLIEDNKLTDKTIESEYNKKSNKLAEKAMEYSTVFQRLISNREQKENEKYTTYKLNTISSKFQQEAEQLENLKKAINPYITVSLWFKTESLKELFIELKEYINEYNRKILATPPQLAKPILYQTNTLHNMIDAISNIYKSRIQSDDITKEHYSEAYNEINYKLWVISSFKHSLENNLWWDNRNNNIIKEIYEEAS